MRLLLRFPLKDQDYEASAEVVRCYNLEKKGKYIIGVKLTQIRQDIIDSILKDANTAPDWKQLESGDDSKS